EDDLAVVATRSPLTSFVAVVDCGRLPRATRPGPRLRHYSTFCTHDVPALARSHVEAGGCGSAARRPRRQGVLRRPGRRTYRSQDLPQARSRASSPGESTAVDDCQGNLV